jgi:protein-S-isoprenylcysteine O-methyltransferase Ste14
MSLIKVITKQRMKVTAILIIIAFLLKVFVFKTVPHSIIGDFVGLIGLTIVVLGCLLRSWSAGVIKKNKSLSQTGPYHFCRNPLYLGSFLIGLGFTIILTTNLYKDMILWLIYFIFLSIYIDKIKSEEKYLLEIFKNDFLEYKKQTGVFYPKMINFKKFKCECNLFLWISNSEFNTWITVLMSSMIIELWSLVLK